MGRTFRLFKLKLTRLLLQPSARRGSDISNSSAVNIRSTVVPGPNVYVADEVKCLLLDQQRRSQNKKTSILFFVAVAKKAAWRLTCQIEF